MKSSIYNVLGTSEAQKLYWDKNLPMSRLEICASINSGRLLGRKTAPNGGYIIDKRSVELDIVYVERIEAMKNLHFKNIKEEKALETLHLRDMREYNNALNKGEELEITGTPCRWCGSVLPHDVECC